MKIHMGKKLISLLIALVLLVPFVPMTEESAAAASSGMVRIKLTRVGTTRTEVSFKTTCAYALNADSSMTIASGSTVKVALSGGNYTVTVGSVSKSMGASFTLNRMKGGNYGVQFTSPSLSNVYCGDLLFSTSGSYIVPVLRIYIEDYLCGVVGYEMSNSYPIEALKAQAIAARTYALKCVKSSGSYDMVDTSVNQVFKGYNASQANVIQAVKATSQQALYAGSTLAGTYYTGSNGGQTESSKNAWGSTSSYLVVKDDPYDLENSGCKSKTLFVSADGGKLNATLKSKLIAEMSDQLAKANLSTDAANVTINSVTSLTPNTPRYADPSRLYTIITFALNVTGKDTGTGESRTGDVSVNLKTYDYLEGAFSLSINSGKNETVAVEPASGGFNIVFRRWGHGVGMSQRGAQTMAKSYSKTGADILEFYFPGTTLKTLTLTDATGSGITNAGGGETITDGNGTYITLKLGSSGLEVQNLQARLSGLGYYHGEILGNFKTQTEEAVKSFQKAAGLKVDGIATPEVQELLFSDKAPVMATPTPAAAIGQILVLADNVSVYESAATSAKVLGTLKRGDVVDMLEYNDTWVKITRNGIIGYALRAGFGTTDATLAPTATLVPTAAPTGIGTVTAAVETKVYAANSTTAQVLGTIAAGETVTLLAENGDWVQVEKNHAIGYALKQAFTAYATAAPVPTAAPITAFIGQVTVKASSVKVYAKASTSGKVLGRVYKNAVFNLVAIEGTWIRIEKNGAIGYAKKSSFTLNAAATAAPTAAATETPAATPAPTVMGKVVVKVSYTKVYASASTSSKSLGKVYRNAIFNLLDYNATWVKIENNGLIGYAKKSAFSMVTDATATPVPTQTPLVSATPAPTAAAVSTPLPTAMARVSVNVTQLSVYEKADSASTLLGKIRKGTIVNLISYTQDWAMIELNGRIGYANRDSLSLAADATAEPTASPTQSGNTQEYEDTFAYVTATKVNVRASASAKAKSLGVIRKRQIVKVLATSGSWAKIELAGNIGYIYHKYLKVVAVSPVVDAWTVDSANAAVNYAVKLYATASTGGNYFGTLKKGTRMEVLAVSGSWCKVVWQGYTGYVQKKYVTSD